MKRSIVILLLLISILSYSQNLQYADSMSRAKADIVLSHFDNNQGFKLLYSVEDKYFYVLINECTFFEEYVIEMDSLGNIINMIEPNKLTRQDKKILKKTTPFDLTKYDTGYITESSNFIDFTFGRLAYFVVKDNNGNRYGEFRSFMPAKISPIDLNLWVYIIRKLYES